MALAHMVQRESVDTAQTTTANTVPDGQQCLRFRTFLLSPPRSTDGLGNRSQPNVQEYAAINMFTVSKIAQKTSNKCPKSDPNSFPKTIKNVKSGSENGIQNETRWRGRVSFFVGPGFQKTTLGPPKVPQDGFK